MFLFNFAFFRTVMTKIKHFFVKQRQQGDGWSPSLSLFTAICSGLSLEKRYFHLQNTNTDREVVLYRAELRFDIPLCLLQLPLFEKGMNVEEKSGVSEMLLLCFPFHNFYISLNRLGKSLIQCWARRSGLFRQDISSNL